MGITWLPEVLWSREVAGIQFLWEQPTAFRGRGGERGNDQIVAGGQTAPLVLYMAVADKIIGGQGDRKNLWKQLPALCHSLFSLDCMPVMKCWSMAWVCDVICEYTSYSWPYVVQTFLLTKSVSQQSMSPNLICNRQTRFEGTKNWRDKVMNIEWLQ